MERTILPLGAWAELLAAIPPSAPTAGRMQ
jgi:hypothetical protein